MNRHQPILAVVKSLTPEHLRLLGVCRSYPTTESGIAVLMFP